MKKTVIVILTVVLMLQSFIAYGQINNAGFEGGIHKNERDYKKTKQYKEVLFLTGQPILVEGTVEIKITDKKVTYEYETSNKDGSITMEREIELERIIDNVNRDNQIVEENNIIDYDEVIEIDGMEYELIDYQFHNSSIDDKQPVVSFYAGNWLGTKTYSINGDQGTVVVDITGDIYGYDHNWGATETQKLHQDISYELNSDEDQEDISWFGYADLDLSFNRTKRMEYFENLPYQTSFDGGYTQTEQEETVMRYNYNLPYIEDGEISQDYRNRGTGEQRFETLPTQKKLFIHKYDDIKGHWAEQDIRRLSGLNVLENDQKYFGPGLETKRVDFARWLVKAMDLVVEEEGPKRSYTKEEVNPPLFSDVTKENQDYDYIKVIKDKNIMQGVGENKFMPQGSLTRAQAITIVIRALGLERIAPNPPFQTRFKDDKSIPEWARKAVYVADQIGLAQGTPEGYIYPNEELTKAEAAVFINRFINYLQEDLKTDYRENIINYY